MVADDQIHLHLSERQAEYLKDIIDFWMDDVQITNEQVHQDPAITSVEMLTICADGIQTQWNDVAILRQNLWEAIKDASNGH